MRQAIITTLLLICSVAHLTRVFGQDLPRTYDNAASTDSLFHRNFFSVLFDRNLNTYNWLSRLIVDTAAAGGHIGLNSQYGSNIILTNPGTPSNQRLRSDQISLATLVSRPVVRSSRCSRASSSAAPGRRSRC